MTSSPSELRSKNRSVKNMEGRNIRSAAPTGPKRKVEARLWPVALLTRDLLFSGQDGQSISGSVVRWFGGIQNGTQARFQSLLGLIRQWPSQTRGLGSVVVASRMSISTSKSGGNNHIETSQNNKTHIKKIPQKRVSVVSAHHPPKINIAAAFSEPFFSTISKMKPNKSTPFPHLFPTPFPILGPIRILAPDDQIPPLECHPR